MLKRQFLNLINVINWEFIWKC